MIDNNFSSRYFETRIEDLYLHYAAISYYISKLKILNFEFYRKFYSNSKGIKFKKIGLSVLLEEIVGNYDDTFCKIWSSIPI